MRRALATALAGLAPAVLPAAVSANELYAVNQASNSMSVIDTATNTVVGSVAVGALPFAVAVAPDGRHAYVTNVGSDDITVVDTAARAVVATVPALDPGGVAVAPDGTRVYVANGGSNSVLVIDTATHAVVDTIGVAAGPRAVAVSPDGGRLYVSSLGTDAVTVIDTSTGSVVTSIPVGSDPVALSITPDGRRVYVANAFASIFGGDDISVIDTASNTVVDTIDPNPFPFGIAVAPDGVRVYTVSSSLSAIDVASATVVDSVPVGNGLNSVAVAPDGERAYVPSNSAGTVSVIDTAGMTLVETIDTGGLPMGVAISPDRGPTAAFASAGELAGGVTAFDARTSTDPDSTIERYDWDFGDGTSATDGGPTPTHIYSSPGTYEVKLTVTNAEGCSSEVVFTGQTAACNGGPKATLARSITIAPEPPPTCSGDSVPVGHGTPTAVALSCTGRVDALQVVADPRHGRLSALDTLDGTVVYTPDVGFAGTDRFRFAATGPGGTSQAATIALTVGPPPPEPAAERRPDRTPPRLSALGLSRRALAIRVSEPATLTIRVARCRTASGLTTCGPGRRIARVARSAGTLRIRLRRPLRAGRYRVTAWAVDPAGNRSATLTRKTRLGPRR